jgi:hypothetical protein
MVLLGYIKQLFKSNFSQLSATFRNFLQLFKPFNNFRNIKKEYKDIFKYIITQNLKATFGNFRNIKKSIKIFSIYIIERKLLNISKCLLPNINAIYVTTIVEVGNPVILNIYNQRDI